MMTSTWHRLFTLIRELGSMTAHLYLLDRALRRLSHRCGFFFYQFLAQPVHDRPRLPPARGRAYSFRFIQTADPALIGPGRPSAVISRCFSQGAQCLLASKNETFVGCIWFVSRVYIEDSAVQQKGFTRGIGWFCAQSTSVNIRQKRLTTELSPFQDCMDMAWQTFLGKILLLLSGDDCVAKEFIGSTELSAAWSSTPMAHPQLTRHDLQGVDHTFFSASARKLVEDTRLDWLSSLAGSTVVRARAE